MTDGPQIPEGVIEEWRSWVEHNMLEAITDPTVGKDGKTFLTWVQDRLVRSGPRAQRCQAGLVCLLARQDLRAGLKLSPEDQKTVQRAMKTLKRAQSWR